MSGYCFGRKRIFLKQLLAHIGRDVAPTIFGWFAGLHDFLGDEAGRRAKATKTQRRMMVLLANASGNCNDNSVTSDREEAVVKPAVRIQIWKMPPVYSCEPTNMIVAVIASEIADHRPPAQVKQTTPWAGRGKGNEHAMPTASRKQQHVPHKPTGYATNYDRPYGAVD